MTKQWLIPAFFQVEAESSADIEKIQGDIIRRLYKGKTTPDGAFFLIWDEHLPEREIPENFEPHSITDLMTKEEVDIAAKSLPKKFKVVIRRHEAIDVELIVEAREDWEAEEKAKDLVVADGNPRGEIHEISGETISVEETT